MWKEESNYEKIDKLILVGMRFADKKAGTKYSAKYDLSPPLIQAVQAVGYWQLLLKRSKGQPVTQSTIDLTYSAAGLPLIPLKRIYRPTIVISLREAIKLK